MAVPVIETWSAADSGTSENTSVSVAAPSGITAGDLLVLIVGNEDSTDTAQFPTTLTNWNDKEFEAGDSTSDTHLAMYWREATGSDPNPATLTATSADYWFAYYLRISGADVTTPIHQTNPQSRGGLTADFDILGVTTTIDDCLCIYAACADGADMNPFSVSGTGWSETDEGDAGASGTDASGVAFCFGQRDLASQGASGTATVTTNAADSGAFFQIAIAPTSGGSILPQIMHHRRQLTN